MNSSRALWVAKIRPERQKRINLALPRRRHVRLNGRLTSLAESGSRSMHLRTRPRDPRVMVAIGSPSVSPKPQGLADFWRAASRDGESRRSIEPSGALFALIPIAGGPMKPGSTLASYRSP